MTGSRVMAGLFLLLALILIFATPGAVVVDALGDPGPVLLPRLVGLGAGILALMLIFQKPEEPESTNEHLEKPTVIALSLAAIPGFYLVFEYFGYTVAVTLYLLTAFCLLGGNTLANRLRYALAATAFSLVSGLVFARLLDLPLPGVMN